MVGYIRTLSCCYRACWQRHTQAPLPCRPVSDVQGSCQCGTNEVELPLLLEEHTGWVQLSITQGTCTPEPWHSWQSAHSCTQGPYLTLAESTLRAMLYPGRPSEANHIHLIQAGFGDVIADGVGLARVRDTAWAALTLWKDAKLTLYLWARQGPAVNFSLLRGKEAKGMDQREDRQKRKDREVIFVLRSSNPTAKCEQLHFF